MHTHLDNEYTYIFFIINRKKNNINSWLLDILVTRIKALYNLTDSLKINNRKIYFFISIKLSFDIDLYIN